MTLVFFVLHHVSADHKDHRTSTSVSESLVHRSHSKGFTCTERTLREFITLYWAPVHLTLPRNHWWRYHERAIPESRNTLLQVKVMYSKSYLSKSTYSIKVLDQNIFKVPEVKVLIMQNGLFQIHIYNIGLYNHWIITMDALMLQLVKVELILMTLYPAG